MLNHSRRIVSRSDSIPRISFSVSVIVWVLAALGLPRLPRRYLAGVASLTTPVNYLSAVQSRGLFVVHPLASSLARRQLSAPLRSGAQAASLGRNLGSDARRILRGQGVRQFRRPFCNLRSEQVRTLAQLLSCRHPWQLWLPSAVVWASIGHGIARLLLRLGYPAPRSCYCRTTSTEHFAWCTMAPALEPMRNRSIPGRWEPTTTTSAPHSSASARTF